MDYVIIGHVTRDLVPGGFQLGGGVTYSGLTAHVLGHEVGILTAVGEDLNLSSLEDLDVVQLTSPDTTTFENQYVGDARIQFLRGRARQIGLADLPRDWRRPAILHLSPVANEVVADRIDHNSRTMVCMTPQGWLRQWNMEGEISLRSWETIVTQCSKADAVVLSREDLSGNPMAEEKLAEVCKVLVITDGASKIHLYKEANLTVMTPHETKMIDPTGAGDIFAAAFFSYFASSHEAIQAVKFASQIAGISVTREGLAGIPKKSEIQSLRAGQ